MNNDEKYVLGAMLRSWDMSNDAFVKSMSILKPEFFTTHSGANIFMAIRSVIESGDIPDPITAEPFLSNVQCQEYERWRPLLVELFRESSSSSNIKTHSQRIKASYDARLATNLFNNALQILNDEMSDPNPRSRIKNALAAVSSIDIDDESNKTAYTMKEILSGVMEDMEIMIERGGGLYGMSTGFEQLDKSLDGLQNGEVYTIVGSPGSGKTTFALNILTNAILDNKKGLFYSLEMPHKQIGVKLLSYKSGVEQHIIKNGDVATRRDNRVRFDAAFSQMMDKNLIIDEGISLTAENMDITTKKHEMQMGGIDIIVLDYLTLLNAQGESETVKATNAAKACKRMAKKYDCPVILLAQPVKNVDGRLKKSDIKQTGQIEQDSAAIMLLYKDNDSGIVEVNIAKNRFGSEGKHNFKAQFATNKFEWTGEEIIDQPEKPKQSRPKGMSYSQGATQ